MRIAGKEGIDGTDTGSVRAALGKDRRGNEAGGVGSATVDDPKTAEMGVAGVHGTIKVE